MWICLNDAFLSVVADKTNPDQLLVRAGRQGEIEKVFPGVNVLKDGGTDYRYRVLLPRAHVARLLAEKIEEIDYSNFKISVTNPDLHDAYFSIWDTMYRYQELEPRSTKMGAHA